MKATAQHPTTHAPSPTTNVRTQVPQRLQRRSGDNASEIDQKQESVDAHNGPNYNFSQIPVFNDNSLRIQPKLKINAPGDRYEQEADRMADRVMGMPSLGIHRNPEKSSIGDRIQRMSEVDEEEEMLQTKLIPGIQQKPLVSQITPIIQRMSETDEEEEMLQTKHIPGIQRKCAKCGAVEDEHIQRKPLVSQITPVIQRMSETDEEEELLQTKPLPGIQRKCAKCEEEEKHTVQTKSAGQTPQSASSFLSSRIQNTRGHGQAMDTATNHFMSSRFGTNFSGVRIHTGSSATQMSQEINAQAFTVGNDVYFNQGKYNPSSSEGKRLLAHELTHVVQQGGSRSPTILRRKKFKPYEATVRKRTKIRNNAEFYDKTGQEYPIVCKTTSISSAEVKKKKCIVLQNPNDNFNGFEILRNSGYTVIKKNTVNVINERRKANRNINPKSRHWIRVKPIQDHRSVEFHYTLRGFLKKITKPKPTKEPKREEKEEDQSNPTKHKAFTELTELSSLYKAYERWLEKKKKIEKLRTGLNQKQGRDSESDLDLKFELSRREKIAEDDLKFKLIEAGFDSKDPIGAFERALKKFYTFFMEQVRINAEDILKASEQQLKKQKKRFKKRSKKLVKMVPSLLSNRRKLSEKKFKESLERSWPHGKSSYPDVKESKKELVHNIKKIEKAHPIFKEKAFLEELSSSISEDTFKSLGLKIHDEKIRNVKSIRKSLHQDKSKSRLRKLNTVIQYTKDDLEIQDNSIHDKVFQKFNALALEDDSSFEDLLMWIDIGLTIIGFIPHPIAKGFSTVGGLVSGTIQAQIDFEDYEWRKAVRDTSFDKADALISEDPSIAWVVFSIAGSVADFSDVLKLLGKGSDFRHAVRAFNRTHDYDSLRRVVKSELPSQPAKQKRILAEAARRVRHGAAKKGKFLFRTLTESRKWAAQTFKLPSDIINNLSKKAIKRLKGLGKKAYKRIRKLSDALKRVLLGCASACKVDRKVIKRYLATAPRKKSYLLKSRTDIMAALPKGLSDDASKAIEKRLKKYPVIIDFIRDAKITNRELGVLHGFLKLDASARTAKETFTRLLTSLIPAKTGKRIDLFNKIAAAAVKKVKGSKNYVNTLKGSMFENWLKLFIKDFQNKSFQRLEFDKKLLGLKKSRKSDGFLPQLKQLFEFKHAYTRIKTAQLVDYLKILAHERNHLKRFKEIIIVFPSKEAADMNKHIFNKKYKGIKVWYVEPSGRMRKNYKG